MAVYHTAPGISRPVFTRRLMIRCPATGLPTETGLEQSTVPPPDHDRGQHLLVDCLECGQDHPWRMEDAFSEPAETAVENMLMSARSDGPTPPSEMRRWT